MRGIAFSVIVEIVIAIVAVGVIFALLQVIISSTENTSLCPIYDGLRALPLPDYLKPYNPRCEHRGMVTQRLVLNKLTDKRLLNGYILDCWKKNDYGKKGIDFICYELYIPKVENVINETTITKVIVSEGLCDKLPNNYLEVEGKNFDCGEDNKLFWKIGNIAGEDVTIIIKYDAFYHRIKVV